MSFRRMVPFLLLNILVSAARGAGHFVLVGWPRPTRRDRYDGFGDGNANGVCRQPSLWNSQANLRKRCQKRKRPLKQGPTVHVVASGETLGTISQRYDVTVEDIMAANGLDNANFLSVGQELTIPVGGFAGSNGRSHRNTLCPTQSPHPFPPPPRPSKAKPSLKSVASLASAN